MIVFFPIDKDRKKYIKIISDFLKFKKNYVDPVLIKTEANSMFDMILQGKDLYGNPYDSKEIFLDERIEHLLEGFYKSLDTVDRHKYSLGDKRSIRQTKMVKEKKSLTKSKSISVEIDPEETKEQIIKIKTDLLKSYPSLDRPDLSVAVDNYVTLTVKLSYALADPFSMEATTIKQLIEAQVRLGAFLGIDEQEKAKRKAAEGNKSIADLALQFKETLEKYPVLSDRFRYKELRILLSKLDRGEIDRDIFNYCTDGFSPEQARLFVEKRIELYE